MARKRIILVGATGSIGKSTLQVLREHPRELELVAVAARNSEKALQEICTEFNVRHNALASRDGQASVADLVRSAEADIVVMASVGAVGLAPTLAAIESGKDVALANKEVLVMAGAHVTRAAKEQGVKILPVDSEHNAIFQCLQALPEARQLRKIILTASGGPFRQLTAEQMANVSIEDAMRHPNWAMGPKITVDSASMANKGLEMIEARWLFDVKPEQIQVVVHPQSIVHSMIECIDGSVLAQMSPPSMTFAIRHALFFPDRARSANDSLDFSQSLSLSFEPPDFQRFPCLNLAIESMKRGDPYPAVFNAANEEAVNAFLENRIPFLAIPKVIQHCLDMDYGENSETLDGILTADRVARDHARSKIANNL